MTTAHRATWNSAKAVSGGDIMQGNYRGMFFFLILYFLSLDEKKKKRELTFEFRQGPSLINFPCMIWLLIQK